MESIDFARLADIEATWEDIEGSYRLAPFETPTNLAIERQKLFEAYKQGRSYDPQFEYLPPPELPEHRIRQFMAQLEPNQSIFERMYYDKARNELLSIECVQRHEPRLIFGLSCLAYGQPDKKLVGVAQQILSKPRSEQQSDQSAEVSAAEAAEALQSVLQGLELHQWRVVLREHALAKMAVDRLDKEIRILASARFAARDVRRLVVHEIGVHVLRYENGRRQPIKLFSNGFNGFLDTEEGLAVFQEQLAGLLEASTLRKYAGRVVAAHLAANGSFSDVFAELASHFDVDTAFDIVARAKRCFIDTTQPGAHTKDIVYLSGFLSVSSHLASVADDRDLLFVGKIGLQHLPITRSLVQAGVITGPMLLPKDLFTNPDLPMTEVD